ncbi:Trank1, partial [Symbiodinium microadriaticum]
APKSGALQRAPKRTQSQRLDVATLYATPVYDKQDLLHQLDRRQFNNTVLQALDNDDLTEIIAFLAWVDPTAKPRAPSNTDGSNNYMSGLQDNIYLRMDNGELTPGISALYRIRFMREQRDKVLENISIYWHGDYQVLTNGKTSEWDEKPYITNGVTNPWVSDWLEVPDAEAFDPEQHCPAGPINDDNRRNPDGFATPGTPRSDITLANSPDFIVIYDTQEHPLLVSVKNPEQVAILPQATDYFIERNHMNLRWFVSSPSLGLMVYATRLEP